MGLSEIKLDIPDQMATLAFETVWSLAGSKIQDVKKLQQKERKFDLFNVNVNIKIPLNYSGMLNYTSLNVTLFRDQLTWSPTFVLLNN